MKYKQIIPFIMTKSIAKVVKSVVCHDVSYSKRKRYNPIGKPRTISSEVVERPAEYVGKILARQQTHGVEQCYSRTIPTQHDDKFGDPGVLGSICQDGHVLMQEYLSAQSKPKQSHTTSKPNTNAVTPPTDNTNKE